MVHEFDSHQGDADRLDALWDDLVQAGKVKFAADPATAPLLVYLNSLTPQADTAARERIRQRVFGARKEEIMDWPVTLSHANGHRLPLASSRPLTAQRPHRNVWRRLPMAAMEVTAAFALLAAIVFGVLLLRPNNGNGPTLPAASTLSSPASTPRPSGDSGSIATIELDNTAANSALFVMVRRVTLPANTRWNFADDAFPPVPVPVNQYVESGILTVGFHGQERAVEAGNNFKIEGGIDYVRNAGSAPVIFLQVLTHDPLKAAPKPPADATVTLICDIPLPRSPEDTWTLVTLNRATLSTAGAGTIPVVPTQQTIFVNVESGELRVSTAWESTGTLLKKGSTLTVADGNRITETEIQGDTPVTLLFLNLQVQSNDERVANDPRAGSTVDWQIPANAETGFALQRWTLDPGARASLDFSGAFNLRMLEGNLTIKIGAQDAQSLGPNQRTAFAGSERVDLSNNGKDPATLIVGFVSAPPAWLGMSIDDREGDIAITPFGTGIVNLPAGPATVSLVPVQAPTELGASATTYLHESASLLAVAGGSVKLTRMAGDIDIWHDVSANSAAAEAGGETPPLGKATEIGVDDSVFVHPRAGYRVERAADSTDSTPTLFALTVTSLKAEPAATPNNEATPAPAEAFTVPGDATCEIAPRTLDDLRAILNPESATGTPNLGLRDQQSAGLPADPATTAGIQQTVRDLAACQANGTALQTYALYSDNAIQLMASANGLTAEDLAAEGDDTPDTTATVRQPGKTISIGDIVTFPDGRAGATVNFDGEIAYLTFVHQGDRWLIDAWDDR
jgi:hypothetical protein